LPVDLPPLAEQRAIAAILGTLDDKIDLNRRLNRTLEATARALFRSWFTDFDPVWSKVEQRRIPGLDDETAVLFPDQFADSEIDAIPAGWEVLRLGDVLSLIETGSRPKGGVGGILSGVPSIGAESIDGLGNYDFGKTKYVSEEFFDGMTKGRIASRDVLLYKDGGRPGEYEPHVAMYGDGFPFHRCSINEHVYRLRTTSALSQSYLYFWLNSDMATQEMRGKGTGVAVPGLNSTAVRSLAILVPSRTVIDRFEAIADPLVTAVLRNSREAQTLAALRDALLPKLLLGEVRVPAAERLVGRAT
jgi:type I restriction enzyme S subunit